MMMIYVGRLGPFLLGVIFQLDFSLDVLTMSKLNYSKPIVPTCIVVKFGICVKKTTINRLRVAYNNCLRKLLGLPRSCSASAMCVYNSIPSFGELCRKSIYNFIQRIQSSTNVLVSSVCNTFIYRSALWQHWAGQLYLPPVII